MKKIASTWLLLTAHLLLNISARAEMADYDFPIKDPYAATILGTPAAQKVSIVQDIPIRLLDLKVFPERKTPALFWYNDKLRCSLAPQKGKAPLIFVIAGTGAGFNSDKMLALQSIFYRSGFHVVSISSPTHANFIVSASESATPGMIADDCRDIYRVMQQVMAKVKDNIQVSDFHLTGYSLGGTQAAFVSKIDDEQKAFNFKKVLMINPPVNLYTSVAILDQMLEKNIPGGVEKIGEALRKTLDKFAEIYSADDFAKFDHEFLFNIYRGLPEPPTDENLKALIGLSFRITSSNMIFTSDVMTNAGFVVPKGAQLNNSNSLSDYQRTLAHIPFTQYFDEFLMPAAKSRNSKVTRRAVIESIGLKSIDNYLKQTKKVGVLTNADDIILAPGDLNYLRQTFGTRSIIFPVGGHCGNINHHSVAASLSKYFTQP